MHRHRQRFMREKRIHPEIDQYLLDGNPERNEQKQIHTFSNPVTRFLFCLFRLQSLTRLLERLEKAGFPAVLVPFLVPALVPVHASCSNFCSGLASV